VLGRSVPTRSIITDLPRSLNSGISSKGGETITCWFGFLSFTNSLKVIEITDLSKFVEKFGGSLFNTAGGVSSFGPPVGETGFAQPAKSQIKIIKTDNLKMNVADFKSECLILCKDAKKGDEISSFNELFKP